jgi:hypothetical protein
MAVPYDSHSHPEQWRYRASGDDAWNQYTDHNGMTWQPVSPLYQLADPEWWKRLNRGHVIELGSGGRPVDKDRSGRVL